MLGNTTCFDSLSYGLVPWYLQRLLVARLKGVLKQATDGAGSSSRESSWASVGRKTVAYKAPNRHSCHLLI